MATSSSRNYYHKLKISLSSVEQNTLKAQLKVYQASQMCKLDQAHELQNAILANKSFFLITIRSIVDNAKKKIIYRSYTAASY